MNRARTPSTTTLAVSLIGLALLASSIAGCTSKSAGPVHRLPDPVFATRQPARNLKRRPQPMRRPTHRAPIAIRPPTPRTFVSAPSSDPGWTAPGGISDRWTDIVIHHSASGAGGAEAFDRHHREVNHWDEMGYHFVIGNGTHTSDGAIEVGSRWTKQKHGAHCKTAGNHYNEHGIGICLVGNFEKTRPTSAQLAGLKRLLAFLQSACDIGPHHVHTHGGVTGRTACPGRFFPTEVITGLGYASRRTFAATTGIR